MAWYHAEGSSLSPTWAGSTDLPSRFASAENWSSRTSPTLTSNPSTGRRQSGYATGCPSAVTWTTMRTCSPERDDAVTTLDVAGLLDPPPPPPPPPPLWSPCAALVWSVAVDFQYVSNWPPIWSWARPNGLTTLISNGMSPITLRCGSTMGTTYDPWLLRSANVDGTATALPIILLPNVGNRSNSSEMSASVSTWNEKTSRSSASGRMTECGIDVPLESGLGVMTSLSEGAWPWLG